MIELLLLGAGALVLSNHGKTAAPAAAAPKASPPAPSQAQAAAAERAALEDDTDVDAPASGAQEAALGTAFTGRARPQHLVLDVEGAPDVRSIFPGSLRDHQSGSGILRGLYVDGVRRDVLGHTLTSDGTVT